jgi:hypothetical protein
MKLLNFPTDGALFSGVSSDHDGYIVRNDGRKRQRCGIVSVSALWAGP